MAVFSSFVHGRVLCLLLLCLAVFSSSVLGRVFFFCAWPCFLLLRMAVFSSFVLGRVFFLCAWPCFFLLLRMAVFSFYALGRVFCLLLLCMAVFSSFVLGRVLCLLLLCLAVFSSFVRLAMFFSSFVHGRVFFFCAWPCSLSSPPVLGRAQIFPCLTQSTHRFRVGQNHIYTVYIRYFWQGNHQIYGHIRCIYTVLANPTYVAHMFGCGQLIANRGNMGLA